MRCLVLSLAISPLAAQSPALSLRVPRGLASPVPGAAGFKPGIAALGRALFFEPSLSIDSQTPCSRCHLPDHGFASVEALPPGSLGRRALRNAPTLFNRAWGEAFSWDGKAKSLEQQVIMPISNPNEMALPIDQAVQRLRRHQTLGARFQRLFGRPANAADLATALASYVRTLVHGDTAVDRFRDGTGGPLTRAERAGLWIYESKGGCWKCHSGGNFTDESFHNTGVGVVDGKPRPGRMAVSGRPADAGRFKTPTLRALTDTGPYMHDGSLQTLEQVVAFYRRGGNKNSGLDAKLKPLSLSDQEAAHLVAFLRALGRPLSKPPPVGHRAPAAGRK